MAQVFVRVLDELLDTSHVRCDPGLPPPGPSHHPTPQDRESSITGLQGPGYVCSALCGPQGPPLLLIGPHDCGKTALLFMAAVVAAEEGAGPVIYLSRDPLQKLPGAGKLARDPLILKQIRFLYPKTLEELLQLLSSLHLTSPSPYLLLLDGLELFLSPGCSPTDGAFLSALLLDSSTNLRCGLLVSAVPPSEVVDGVFMTVERYFPNQCHLSPEVSTDVEQKKYSIAYLNNLPERFLHIHQDGTLRIFDNQPNKIIEPNGQKIGGRRYH
ncbi:ATPase SWSAP1 [Pelobates cultripes]|uniref:ATPase SWSAP1 n=1 Tax=Pelobates cultripes TaxID=61616 RepID=A0AAD1RJD6_PELCU|nr:ATPase SWSAP1 [Pelobates cultripes]